VSKNWKQIRDERMSAPEAQAGYREAALAHEIGEQVRALRVEAGLTQQELADAIGTTQSAVARLEGGGSVPTLGTLDKVAGALGRELHVEMARREPEPA
jgi:HTH-type transcriptional regulator / antitoxin HipB